MAVPQPQGSPPFAVRRDGGAVVRPLSRAAQRPCARPGCPSPASATLTFRYDAREVRIAGLAEQVTPEAYDLCAGHAGRTTAPRGWSLSDVRDPDEQRLVTPPTARELGSDETVAVLAAALRAAEPLTAPDQPARAEAETPTPEPMGLQSVPSGRQPAPSSSTDPMAEGGSTSRARRSAEAAPARRQRVRRRTSTPRVEDASPVLDPASITADGDVATTPTPPASARVRARRRPAGDRPATSW